MAKVPNVCNSCHEEAPHADGPEAHRCPYDPDFQEEREEETRVTNADIKAKVELLEKLAAELEGENGKFAQQLVASWPPILKLISQLEGERNRAWQELREIRALLKANPEESTVDEVSARLHVPGMVNLEPTLKAAADFYGSENQLRALQEECGELVAAVNQFFRGRILLQHLLEEVADVSIMSAQMAVYWPSEVSSARTAKLNRLKERLAKGETK